VSRKYPTAVYISSHDKGEAEKLAAALRAAGHNVVSTWQDEPPYPEGKLNNAPDDDKVAGAEVNVAIIARRTAVLVLIAGPDKYTGGKFVEAGVALAVGARVVVLGRRENALLYHPKVDAVSDVDALITYLEDTRS
jgi:hypothetical protein